MKIFKYKFEIPNIQLDANGELIEGTPTYKDCTFTLLHGGVGRFEEYYGTSFMKRIMELNKGSNEDIAFALFNDRKFVVALAGASYVKIENGAFQNDRSTMDEFINGPLADLVMNTEFMIGLLQMATECVIGKVKKKENAKKSKNAK